MPAILADKAADGRADLQIITMRTMGQRKLLASFTPIADFTIAMDRLEIRITFSTAPYLWR